MKKAIDYDALTAALGDAQHGPTVAQEQRDARMLDLMEKLLAVPQVQASTPTVSFTAPPVSVPPAQVVVAPAPAQARCAWTFTFERNTDNTIKSITATPHKE